METHSLACSEVWGGNEAVLRAVSMPGLDAHVLSRPHAGDAAGGDVHYLSSGATGRIGRVMIADVAGHGRDVASLAVRLRAILRRHVNYVDQSRVMQQLNREFLAEQKQQAGRSRFATAIVGTFWGPTSELDLTNAGHPPPLLYRAATRVWELVEAKSDEAESNVPLGILESGTYTRQQLRLAQGDVLVLYTDALMEATSKTGTTLGTRGLLALVQDMEIADAGRLTRMLMDRVRAFAGSELDDDATIMALTRNSVPAAAGSLASGLASTARLAKEFAASLVGATGFAWPQARVDNVLGAYFERFNRR